MLLVLPLCDPASRPAGPAMRSSQERFAGAREFLSIGSMPVTAWAAAGHVDSPHRRVYLHFALCVSVWLLRGVELDCSGARFPKGVGTWRRFGSGRAVSLTHCVRPCG